MRVVRAAARAPRLGPVATLERRVVRPLGPRGAHPLLDVAEQIVDAEGAPTALARPGRLCLVEPPRLFVADVVVLARQLGCVVALVGLVVDATAGLERVPVAEREHVRALASRLPLELGAQPLADGATARLGLREAHHHGRQLPFAVRPLEAVHADGDGGFSALVRGEPGEVLPTRVLGEAKAKPLDVLVVEAHHELHVGRAWGERLGKQEDEGAAHALWVDRWSRVMAARGARAPLYRNVRRTSGRSCSRATALSCTGS